jgi:hypothetical protein
LLASSAGLLTLVRTQGTLTSMANKAQSAARDLAQGIVSVGWASALRNGHPPAAWLCRRSVTSDNKDGFGFNKVAVVLSGEQQHHGRRS